MKPERIVVLGIGNILLADEGVGVRAVEQLQANYRFPPQVELYDGGTTGMMGLLPLIEEADALLVFDAAEGVGEPGTLFRYTVADFRLSLPKKLSGHDVGFIECLTIAEINGWLPEWVTVVGMKVAEVKEQMALSPLVTAQLPAMVALGLEVLATLGVESVYDRGNPPGPHQEITK